jgi:hypothetical protein
MSEKIEQAVRSRYGSVAVSKLSSKNDGVRAVAEAFGYTQEELSSIPAEAIWVCRAVTRQRRLICAKVK